MSGNILEARPSILHIIKSDSFTTKWSRIRGVILIRPDGEILVEFRNNIKVLGVLDYETNLSLLLVYRLFSNKCSAWTNLRSRLY